MKQRTVWQTCDGIIHFTVSDARRHADRRYGDALLRHGRALANQKYTDVTEYLDKNLAALVDLHALRADIECPADDDDDDE